MALEDKRNKEHGSLRLSMAVLIVVILRVLGGMNYEGEGSQNGAFITESPSLLHLIRAQEIFV